MIKSSKRVYEYILKPYLYSKSYIKIYKSFDKILIYACALENNNYNYNGDKTPIYVVVSKQHPEYPNLIELLTGSINYYDHYQEGGIDSNIVVIVLETDDSDVINKFKEGKYSEMYMKRTTSGKSFSSMYLDDPVPNMSFNKAFYVMNKSEDYFESIIYPLVKDLGEDAISTAFENEYDSKPEEHELLLNMDEVKKAFGYELQETS